MFLGLPGNTTLNLRAATPFLGVIYAPNAACTISGAGGVAQVHGAIVCRTLTLGSHMEFHYDEAVYQ
jgi:choice-of-anchor A domain-containing protein